MLKLIADEKDRGLIIIDAGVSSNCGYGTGNAVFYEITRVSKKEKLEELPFEKETLALTSRIQTAIKYLSGGDIASQH